MCIHIIFYDDRNFPGQNDQTADPVFDAYYAWSPLDDLDFQDPPDRNQKLYAELDPPHPPDPPALDFSLDVFGGFEPGEYIGISYYRDTQEERDEVWTAFTGTDPSDANEQSVIWSSFINWWEEP